MHTKYFSVISVITLCLIPFIIFGQKDDFYHHNISFDFGIHHNQTFKERYTPPRLTYSPTGVAHAGYTSRSRYSIQNGILYNTSFKNTIHIKGGLLYMNKRYYSHTDPDSIEKYIDYLDYNPSVVYNTSIHSLLIPIYCGYKYKNISAFIGTKIEMFIIRKDNRSLYDGETKSYASTTSFIKANSASYQLFHFSARVQYLLVKEPEGYVYLAIDKEDSGVYYIQAGIEIKLITLN